MTTVTMTLPVHFIDRNFALKWDGDLPCRTNAQGITPGPFGPVKTALLSAVIEDTTIPQTLLDMAIFVVWFDGIIPLVELSNDKLDEAETILWTLNNRVRRGFILALFIDSRELVTGPVAQLS
jgi:hypothetical protein